MLSHTICFLLVALTWAFPASNKTSPFFAAQQGDFEPKGVPDMPQWIPREGVHNAQLPESSTVPSGIRILDTNPLAQTQGGVGGQNAQANPMAQVSSGKQGPHPLPQIPQGVQGPNTSPFGSGWPRVQGPNTPPFGHGSGVQDPNPPNFGHGSGVQDPNPLNFGYGPGVQAPYTPNFGQVPPGTQGPSTIFGQVQQVAQGPIALEQLRQIFEKSGNASVVFIIYTYVNLLNRGSVDIQPYPFNQPPPSTWPQPPGILSGSVYPPNQNPYQQPSSTTNLNVYPPNQNPWLQSSGTINGNVYPPKQIPSQQTLQKTNGKGYLPNPSIWRQQSQRTKQSGLGYSSYQNPYPTWQQLPQAINGSGSYPLNPVSYPANQELTESTPKPQSFKNWLSN